MRLPVKCTTVFFYQRERVSYLFPEVLDSIKYIFFLVYLAKGDKILSKYFAMRRLISSEM